MLTAQLSLLFQPIMEKIRTRHNDFKRLQSDVLISLGLIIRIDLLQGLIQDFCKLVHRVRHHRKFNQPLMTALGIGIHKHRSSRIFRYLSTRSLACCCQSLFSIVYHEFLTKRIDKMFGSSCYDKFIRVFGRKLHGITNHVSPQTTSRTNQHGIILTNFHSCQRNDMRIRRIKLIHWQEFIEYTIVNHQHHSRIGRIVLQAEETFTGIVGFHIMHFIRANQLLVLFTIRRECNTSMEEHFQIRPYFR